MLPPDLAAPPVWAQRLATTLATIASPLLWLSRLIRSVLGFVLPQGAPTLAAELAPVADAEPAAAGEQEAEEEHISRILRLERPTARDIMVPRMDVVAVPADTPVSEVVELARQAGHSRLPVYRGSIDSIVGIVYTKDLLRFVGESAKEVTALEVMRPAYGRPGGQSRAAPRLRRRPGGSRAAHRAGPSGARRGRGLPRGAARLRRGPAAAVPRPLTVTMPRRPSRSR